ncbi:phosphoribosylglycinamide formyltransferase [Thiomicrorhabdus sp. ZW0627]|uniref:phosphoribosylglycinamide formyltransferase n=1 Tax=Thiomicrorhabdus sp. ZW0627 TaxID=3039774 RepID=UPI00243691AA|nr:phosphoribosylglycinamide formyltransferase [Thiomicrorhabdus sp. ZW0627]MDG6773281.1 phosphoribosylglycinamide formyltransferase [Thiomicrorhabdus sp. ZW0627]
MKQPLRIAVLISGSGSNLQAIIEHQKHHPNLYEIVLVLSNKADAYGLVRAENAGIEHIAIDHRNFPDRAAFDAELQKEIDDRNVDLVVLAGFMRILSNGFTEHYLGRMLNIHPSLLPKYPGLDTHQKAIDAGDAEHGLSVHFVTPELDGGPIILQSSVNIEAKDDATSLRHKIHRNEHLAYPLVIQWFAEGKLKFENGKVWYNQQPLAQPLILESIQDAESQLG